MTRPKEIGLPSASLKVQLLRKDEWNARRSLADADFFTAGYSGRSLSEFLVVLKSTRVSTVVDVRRNPVSRYKPAFSKKNLQAGLEVEGIAYLHLGYLGVPRDIRSLAVENGDRNRIWDWYDTNVLEPLDIHALLNQAEHPLALLCTEVDPASCHRHRLALALEKLGLRSYDL